MILPFQDPTVHIPPSPFFPPAPHWEQVILCQRRGGAAGLGDSWAHLDPWAMQTVTSCWDQTSLQLCLVHN